MHPYSLKLSHGENRVVIEYDPKLMLERIPGSADTNAEDYAKALEHIRRRIDWCIRKSAGQNPDIDRFGAYE
jgi:hypothetical protein